MSIYGTRDLFGKDAQEFRAVTDALRCLHRI